ncbi:MAG: hypothetical protein ACYTF5_04405 [Planctomycetota bacterium]|jgi:hypothetical protein
MLPRAALLVSATILLTVGLAGQEGPKPQQAKVKPSVPAPLAKQIPALNAQSSWAQDAEYQAQPDQTSRGIYAVGNGHVFTYLGLGARANTMQAITGPHYQTNEIYAPKGHFGELTMTLVGEGSRIALPDQRVRRVTGANFVVTEDAAPTSLSLRTLTFAKPDGTTITRVVEVHNTSKTATGPLTLVTRLEGKLRADGKQITSCYQGGKRSAFCVFSISAGKAGPEGFTTELEPLQPNERWVGILTASTGSGKAPPAGWSATKADMGTAIESANATLNWWKATLKRCPRIDTDHRRLGDLLKDWQVLTLTLRCAQSGVVVPMVNHRGAWIRESCGPMLLFLRHNMWAEARQMLRFFHDVIRLKGEIPEHVPLDIDLSGVKNQKTDWQKIKIPAGDLASWVILQHFWYFRATHDTKLIEEHLPLLTACLKGQKRAEDSMLGFSGHESYLRPRILKAMQKGLGHDPLFVTLDPKAGRQPYSMVSGTLFLIALQGYGEMLDGIDRVKNPDKYASGDQDVPRPGKKFLNRSFDIMADLEKRFFISGPERFAPAVSPVTGEQHTEPFANMNLTPIWVGFTFPTGERSRDNLRFTLHRLQFGGGRARVGTTRTVKHLTGEVPGMVLTGLVERDGKRRQDALTELLTLAEPAGEWAELYDSEGREVATEHPNWPNRLRPNECGINMDAIWFALTGVRHVNVPNFDDDSIKVKLRMPPGMTHMSLLNLRKDDRAFNLYIHDQPRFLTADEIKQQKNLPADQQRDPKKKHRRFHFRMELVSDNPTKGYWQVDANVMGTMFVRYLRKDMPVMEQEFWKEDQEEYFPGTQNLTNKPAVSKAAVEGAQTLLLTNRKLAADLWRDREGNTMKDVTVVDTGLPMSVKQLASLLVDEDGKLRHKTLFLDMGYDATDARTYRSSRFWQTKAWQDALKRFRAGGGELIQARPIESFQIQKADGSFGGRLAKGGRLELDAGTAPRTVRVLVESDREREAVLRVGTGCGYTLVVNDDEIVSEAGGRVAVPDQDAEIIDLRKGNNIIELRLRGDGQPVVYCRITDPRGRPIRGVQAK